MQEYDKNMHKYAIVKYAQICTNMQKICKKYAQICNNMQGLGTLQNRQKYANYMQIICMPYAKTCKICNHDLHMQNMQKYAPPTLLMKASRLRLEAVGQMTTRSTRISPRLRRSLMLTFATKKLSTGAKGQKAEAEFPFCPRSFDRAVMKGGLRQP